MKHSCRTKVAFQKRDNGQAGKVDHLKHVCRMVATDLERGESQATKKVIHVLLGDASLALAVRRLTCGCGPFADTTGRAGVVAVLIRRSSWLALRDHFRGKAGVLQTTVRRWPRRWHRAPVRHHRRDVGQVIPHQMLTLLYWLFGSIGLLTQTLPRIPLYWPVVD